MTNTNGSTLRILIIEDDNNDVELIVRALRRSNGYKIIYQAVDTEAALSIALDQPVWDVVLCDYKLPVLSPYRALEMVKSINYDLPFLVLSGSVHEDIAIDLLKAGASDFISKSNLARLPLAIRRELRQIGDKKYVDERTKLKIAKSYDMTIAAWGKALEMRDIYTHGHTVRVTDLTLRLARAMRLSKSEFENIHRGALLHDIGKMGITDMVLLKQDVLTPEERKVMEMHPVIAHDMLSGIPFLADAINIPYCHHEKWDGTGYPRGLQGDEIPFEARLFSVADVYDALTSERPYRKSWSKERALEYIESESGKSFDPNALNKFLEMMR
jgi:Response regulator containing a CheY-like receiver domain and an HD-GYP domain